MNEIEKKFINDIIENQAFFVKMIKEQEREIAKLNAIIDSYQPRLQKYKDILQEIKEIAEKEYYKNFEDKDCLECDNSFDEILSKISKMENEQMAQWLNGYKAEEE